MTTDPLATIIGLLNDGSTGLNTTGYEIYEDNGSTECTLLVTYKLAKEKLTAIFGGTQDVDVIITVEAGEGPTDWIGFSTQVHTLPVIITVHVIEKHSATGSANKIITPELVRWKAFDILSKFIDANVASPGGNILTWEHTGQRTEEDMSVRPIIYKYIIETECKVVR